MRIKKCDYDPVRIEDVVRNYDFHLVDACSLSDNDFSDYVRNRGLKSGQFYITKIVQKELANGDKGIFNGGIGAFFYDRERVISRNSLKNGEHNYFKRLWRRNRDLQQIYRVSDADLEILLMAIVSSRNWGNTAIFSQDKGMVMSWRELSLREDFDSDEVGFFRHFPQSRYPLLQAIKLR